MSIRRDYKPAANRQRRRQNTRRHGLLVLTLVLIGLFGGLLAYIKGDRNQPPMPEVATSAQRPAPAAVPPAPKVAAPVAEPASEPAPTRPKYDFYTELPKRQVEIPPDDPAPRPALRPAPPRHPPANEPPRKPAAQQKSAPTPNMAATAGLRPANGHSGE